MDLSKLLDEAKAAASRAYAPYSKFTVGAAIQLKSGEIVSGCNVENASYGVTICAERVAACTAVAAGNDQWHAIVIVSPSGVSPCGACRQFLAEFAPQLPIYFGSLTSNVEELKLRTLDELLPDQMSL
jgi:cytidine deaminase